MNTLLALFLTFFKLGAFTFGGGYAMISLIENEVVTKKGWLTRDEMLDIITIAESTPGPLAINMATFVGTKIKGFVGALIATIGLVIPPFVIIVCIALVLDAFKEITVIAYALKGIQAGVVVLILNAFLKFFKGMEKSILSFIFLIVAFLVSLFTSFDVVFLILIGAVVGVSITMISSHLAKKKIGSAPENSEPKLTNNGTDLELAGGMADDATYSESENDENNEENVSSWESENIDLDAEDIDANIISNEDENSENTLKDAENTDNSSSREDIDTIKAEPNTQNEHTYTIDSTDDEEDSDI